MAVRPSMLTHSALSRLPERACSANPLLTDDWANDAVWRKPDGSVDALCRVCLREGEASDERCPCGTLVCGGCREAHFPEENAAPSKSSCVRCRKFCPRRKEAPLPSRRAEVVVPASALKGCAPGFQVRLIYPYDERSQTQPACMCV